MGSSYLARVSFLTTLFFLFTIALTAQTEPTERVKNRARNRTNQRVDRKIDEGVDRALDKVEGLFRGKKRSEPSAEVVTDSIAQPEETAAQEPEVSGLLRGLGQPQDFEPYENPVKMNLLMDITTTDKRGKAEQVELQWTFDTWQTGMQTTTEDGTMRLLMDNQEGSVTIVSESGADRPTAMKMRQRTYDLSEVEPDPSSFTVRATGNTRIINGYACSEYIIEHEEGTTTTWLTKDLDLAYSDFVRAMASQANATRSTMATAQQDFAYEGFPIESTTVSANGKESTTMLVKEIKVGEDIDLSVFDLDGVQVRNLGF